MDQMINKKKININISLILYSLLIAMLFILAKGYMFNTGDQAEHLPPVYKLIDPCLYSHDYYMIPFIAEGFTVRFFYVYFIYYLSFIISVPAICFLITVLSIALTSYSISEITRFFTKNQNAIYLSPVLVLLVFYNYTLGGNNIQYSYCISSGISKAIITFGILKFFKKNYIYSGLMLGIASLFHPLAGLQIFLILFLVLIFKGNSDIKKSFIRLLRFSILFIIPALLAVLPVIFKQTSGSFIYDKKLYNTIMYYFKFPQHFNPLMFPLLSYIKFIALLVVGIFILSLRKFEVKKEVNFFFIITISGMILYTMFFSGLKYYEVGKVQWFKTSIWIVMFSSILISSYVSGFFPDRLTKLLIKNTGIISIILICISGFIILDSQAIPIERIQNRYMVGKYRKSDLTKIHEWIEKNTPVDAVFLTSPDDFGFLAEAKRSLITGYKAMLIHNPEFIINWYLTYKEIYGVGIDDVKYKYFPMHTVGEEIYPSDLYNTRNVRDFYPSKYKIDYRIDNIRDCKYLNKLGSQVHREGDYVVTKFNIP